MRKSAACLVVGMAGCLWFAAAVRGEEPAGPQHRVEVAVELKWPLEGSLSFFKHVFGQACEQAAPAKTAATPCPSDMFERIGIDFDVLPAVGEHQILMFPPFVSAPAVCPQGACLPNACLNGACFSGPAPQFGAVKFVTGCPGECVSSCAAAGCTAAKCSATNCTAAGCAVRCSGECPCTPKSSACACDDCQCGDCKCSPAASKLPHAGLIEHLLEVSVEKAALEATLEAHSALAEEREEMFSTVAELMVENAKLTAKLEFQGERDELNKQLLELATQNVQLKAEIAVTQATAKIMGESLQLALEKERLQSRVAELERQVQGDEVIRTAKRPKATR